MAGMHQRGGTTHALNPHVLDAGDDQSNGCCETITLAVNDAVVPSPCRKK
jgi:hypothetical protein